MRSRYLLFIARMFAGLYLIVRGRLPFGSFLFLNLFHVLLFTKTIEMTLAEVLILQSDWVPILEVAGPLHKVNLLTDAIWKETENLVFFRDHLLQVLRGHFCILTDGLDQFGKVRALL